MYLLYSDETNLDAHPDRFFVYGGIAIPSDSGIIIHTEVENLRNEYCIDRQHFLKFNPPPSNLDHDSFKRVKQRILEVAASNSATLFAYLIYHNIIHNGDIDDARRKGINTVLYHFDCFLHNKDDHGLVLLDRCSDSQMDTHAREKFTTGVQGLPYSKEYRLKRVLGCHYSTIGQSHFCSIIDIAIGSLRFAINAISQNDNSRLASAKSILELLRPLFYPHSGRIDEISLCLRPQVVKHVKYREEYARICEALRDNGIDIAQNYNSPSTPD